MLYEIRRYQTRPGRRDAWVKYMTDVIIPFQVSKGVSVIATFVTNDNPDGYLWIRRFDNEQQRIALYTAVYESQRWTDELGPQCEQFLISSETTVTMAAPIDDRDMSTLGQGVP
jgi:hypothetical protein